MSVLPGWSAVRASYEPFVQAAAIRLHQNGYSETAASAGLIGTSRNYDLQTSTLGLRNNYGFGASPLTIHSVIGWRHAYGDVTPAVLQTFAAGSPAFSIAGVAIDRDVFLSELSLDYAFARNVTVGLSYGGQFGRRSSDDAIKGRAEMRF